jgi:sugar lactone lactonase YvrE
MTSPLASQREFPALFSDAAQPLKIAGHCLWAEGPAYLPQEQALV